MKNPFPGMNPFLERYWNDVHTRLCASISAALQPALPPGLRARAEEEVVLETVSGTMLGAFRADSVVIETRNPGSRERGSSVATVEPLIIQHTPKILVTRWVKIIDVTDGERVVTAIEILSPGNKAAGTLNKKYRRKLRSYIEAGVNVVEIDLLRSSRKRLEIRTEELPPDRRAPYLVCIHRASGDEGEWEVYPMRLREPLPTIPIPCRHADPDVALALQPLIDRTYVDGGYDYLDYAQPLKPPLSEADREWALNLAGQRQAT